MSGEIKSSLQIALEKLQRLKEVSGEEEVQLSPEQKKKIAEVKDEFAAKVAEQEIMLQSEVKKLASRYGYPELEERLAALKKRVADEKAALIKERDAKIGAIRRGKK